MEEDMDSEVSKEIYFLREQAEGNFTCRKEVCPSGSYRIGSIGIDNFLRITYHRHE